MDDFSDNDLDRLDRFDEEIPPLRRPEEMPPVRSQADLHRHWRALMGELGFGETSLWITFFEPDGSCTPLLQQVIDLPDVPDDDLLDGLMRICQQVTTAIIPGGSVAFLRSRPGQAGFTAADRVWATTLACAAAKTRLRTHPVHLANDHDLRVFTMDDQIASA